MKLLGGLDLLLNSGIPQKPQNPLFKLAHWGHQALRDEVKIGIEAAEGLKTNNKTMASLAWVVDRQYIPLI
ncbi:hypothetical protein [Leptolyngbya sp. KIOST-1]|uniref:hypothetical protein n=1 Tax=Leptolyngbya sp. KIOST-1 TaxID=1229172 RepID=UPI0005623013|nr:hypothetical protein [Leptolyngbya sp. KIOST-1]